MEKIAEELKCAQRTVSEVLENFRENGHLAEIPKTFKMKVYSEWNCHKTDPTSMRKRSLWRR